MKKILFAAAIALVTMGCCKQAQTSECSESQCPAKQECCQQEACPADSTACCHLHDACPAVADSAACCPKAEGECPKADCPKAADCPKKAACPKAEAGE